MKDIFVTWRKLLIEEQIKLTIGDQSLDCPAPTQDLELNTENRDAAIEAPHIQYGPLNLADEDYWVRAAEHWNTEPEVAKKSRCSNCVAFDISPRMLECLPGPVSEPIEDAEGKLGYCWMHHFKCHSARACYTWAAGGPITEDKTSQEWQEKTEKSLDEKKDDRCTRIAKRKYDVWPSAYASGAVVRCRKGKIWKGVKEGEDDVRDKYGSEVSDRYKKSLKKSLALVEEEDNLEAKIRKALRDEGGAAGMDALEKHTKASATEIKKAIEEMDDVGRHEDGDYILEDGEEVNIANEDLRKWFGRKGAKGKESGWVDCNTCRKDKKTGKKTCKACGRQEGEKRAKYPSCRPTPSACGDKGRGKSWGKKSAKKEGLEITREQIEKIILEELNSMVYYHITDATYDDGTVVEDIEFWDDVLEEAEYQGRKVTLNKPMRGDVKKSKVYVKNAKGNVVKVNFGDPNMRIKKSNPQRRKSFRARHNCDNPGPKWKARYWSCKAW